MIRPLAITCGDPAGVGPEIAVAAHRSLGAEVPMIWIGDPRHLPEGTDFRVIHSPEEATTGGPLPVLAHSFPNPATAGRPDPANAQGVVDVIARAVTLTREGRTGAVVTAPISKKILIDGAGFPHPGHTEYLSALAGGVPVVMMLACPALRVVPATIHIALSSVPTALTAEGLESTIRITHAALIRDFGIALPRIAVAGLNPHAGEGGAMGHEDATLIAPVIQRLARDGMAIRGPLSADTMFHAAARETYDAAIAMYHDQALIPIKTIDFSGGVNVTLGLPFVRTSPDHGTAFDIAGQGIADPTSMIAAVRMAASMAEARG